MFILFLKIPLDLFIFIAFIFLIFFLLRYKELQIVITLLIFNGVRFNIHKFICRSLRSRYDFICYNIFISSFIIWSEDVIRIPNSSLWSLSISFFHRGEQDQGNVAIDDDDDDDDDSVEQTFCHRERGVGSRIDLRVIGNPNAVNLGKLVSTSSPRDLLLFPPGMARKRIFASTVFTRSGKFNLTL